MLKKLSNLKLVISVTLLLALLVFIFILSWIPLDFDLEHLNVSDWVSNSLVNMGIMICAIILGEIFCDDKLKENVKGLYQIALSKFNEILKRLTEVSKIIVYFSQWYILFKARELKRKKESYLVDNGFDQQAAVLIIKYIEREDLEKMREGVVTKIDKKTGKEIKFKKIYDDEYDVLQDIFTTDFQIDAPNYTYYLSAFNDSSSTSTLEQAKKLEKKDRLNKTFNRVFKIVLSLFISFIWGMAFVNELKQGGVQEAAVRTVFRFISLIGGLLGGVLTSVVSVKIAAQKLENKAQVLTFYEIDYNNNEFTPKSYDELVEEEIQKEQENEEAKESENEIVNEEAKTANDN